MTSGETRSGAGEDARSDRGKARTSGATDGGAVAGLRIEEALERLEEIAAQLEGGDLDLERALTMFREARGLYGHCVQRLGEAEQEVRVLMADGGLAPLDEDVDGDEAPRTEGGPR